MTSRERLLAVLNGRPADRPAWTTLVDDVTRSALPPDLQACSALDFYRRIGCDFASLGNYGLAENECVSTPCRLVMPEADERAARSQSKSGHPTRYPLQTPDDVAVLTRMWLDARYEECDGTEQSYRRFEEAAGDDALYLAAVGCSVVQHLIQHEAGVEGFYYLRGDHTPSRQESDPAHVRVAQKPAGRYR